METAAAILGTVQWRSGCSRIRRSARAICGSLAAVEPPTARSAAGEAGSTRPNRKRHQGSASELLVCRNLPPDRPQEVPAASIANEREALMQSFLGGLEVTQRIEIAPETLL